MIVRDILHDPGMADNFDHFNDYDDTMCWLQGLKSNQLVQTAIERLSIAYSKSCEVSKYATRDKRTSLQ